MDSIKDRARHAVIWDFLGTLFTRVGYFSISVILARLLTPEDYGIVGMVLVLTGVVQGIVDLGFSTAIIQVKEVNDVQLSTTFFLNLIISSLFSVVVFLLSSVVADIYESGSIIKSITEALSLIFVINGLNSVHISLMKRELRLKAIAKANFISTIVAGISAVIAAYNDLRVWSLVLQVFVYGISNLVIIWLSSKWRPSLIFNLKSVRGLWNFGGFMFLDSIFATLYSRIDVFFIGKIYSPATLGLYLRSKSINSLVVEFSSQSISKVLFPAISRVQEDVSLVREYLIRALDVVGLVTFFLLGWMFLTASESIIILFGEVWSGSIKYYRWLALIGYGFPIGSILISALRGQGHSKLYFVRSLFIYMVASVAYIIGYLYGIDAFLKALTFTTAVGVLINIYFSKITTGVSYLLHLYHSFYFAIVSIVSVLLVNVLFDQIESNNYYQTFAGKTILYVFAYFGQVFLFRKNLLIGLLNLGKVFLR